MFSLVSAEIRNFSTCSKEFYSLARYPGPASGPHPGEDLPGCVRMNDDLRMDVSIGLYFTFVFSTSVS